MLAAQFDATVGETGMATINWSTASQSPYVVETPAYLPATLTIPVCPRISAGYYTDDASGYSSAHRFSRQCCLIGLASNTEVTETPLGRVYLDYAIQFFGRGTLVSDPLSSLVSTLKRFIPDEKDVTDALSVIRFLRERRRDAPRNSAVRTVGIDPLRTPPGAQAVYIVNGDLSKMENSLGPLVSTDNTCDFEVVQQCQGAGSQAQECHTILESWDRSLSGDHFAGVVEPPASSSSRPAAAAAAGPSEQEEKDSRIVPTSLQTPPPYRVSVQAPTDLLAAAAAKPATARPKA